MVGFAALWLPILLSAVIVFIASSIIHMVLGYHKGDFRGMPGEAPVLEAMRKAGVGPGDYSFPRAESMAQLREPEMIKKYEQGPVGLMTVHPNGPPAMGMSLTLWFLFGVAVSIMAAYITGRTQAPGADYIQVFRISSTVAFLAYAGSEPVASIWYKRSWSTTLKNMCDGLVYALLTGGVFGWLWPG
jgi:hypothetical protein